MMFLGLFQTKSQVGDDQMTEEEKELKRKQYNERYPLSF